jgi:hypothetical protein
MQASDDLTLRAFFNALAQLEPPLDGQIQHELNQIAPTLQQDEATAAKNLRLIAEKYHPLHELYRHARKEFQKTHHVQPRNKSVTSLENFAKQESGYYNLAVEKEPSIDGNHSENVSFNLVQSLHKALSAPQLSEAIDIAKHFSRLSNVYTFAIEVFENAETAWKWLQQANRALDGAVPIQLLETESGTEQVTAVLNRIEYGGYS